MVKPSSSDTQKGFWNDDEDEKTITCALKQNGTGNWTTFSKRSGQRKGGKNNKEKWSSNQKIDPKHKIFTPQEEELVIQLHAAIGSRWPIIAQQLPGKTDNDVKILWNSKLRKKLSAMGIDPVTHKPFSQILADYGNIGGFPKGGRTTRFTSLSRDLKNAIMLKPEQPHFPSTIKTESDHHSLQLYSQLQAVNLVTEASNYMPEYVMPSESIYSSLNQEISSFSWNDFFLEDAFLASDIDVQENVVQCDENVVQCDEENIKSTTNNSFGPSSSSNSSSFVEAMIGSQDEEMFSHLPCSYEDPFYY
ncbi:hypothetical protein ACS0TY_034402 [Phlomoides rotata]